MPNKQLDQYFVAVKVFLEKDNKFLILKDGFGQWDLPGGRIKKDEFDAPLEQIVARKMIEELGSNFKYELGKPVVFMRHERIEKTEGSPTVRIFAVGYQAKFKSGDVQMTSHHTEMIWADINSFNPDEYFSGGWLKGVKEYLKLRSEK